MIAHFARVLIVGTAIFILGISPSEAEKGPTSRLVEGSIKFEKINLPDIFKSSGSGSSSAAPKVLSEDWYVIEVKFDTEEELTEEVTVKFFTDMVDTLKEAKSSTVILTSEVTFINVPKGNGHLATAYLHPSAVKRYGGTGGAKGIKKANVHVDLIENGQSTGAGIDFRQEKEANWYTMFTQIPGILVNLKDSPFWPSETLKFNQIKATTR